MSKTIDDYCEFVVGEMNKKYKDDIRTSFDEYMKEMN